MPVKYLHCGRYRGCYYPESECLDSDLDVEEKEVRKGRALRRKTDFKKAIRKKKIINGYGWDYYSNLHQYSKNKIHCSCPLCRAKTAKRRPHAWGPGGKNWTICDRKKIERLDGQLEDFYDLSGEQNE